jgi:hypothetical protein
MRNRHGLKQLIADVHSPSRKFNIILVSLAKETFGNISLMRLASVRALDIRDEREISRTDTARTCSAIISATNARDSLH